MRLDYKGTKLCYKMFQKKKKKICATKRNEATNGIKRWHQQQRVGLGAYL